MYNKREQKLLYLNAKKLYINKKYSSFEKEATKYLEKYPDDVAMRFMRAKTYRALNRFEEAINDLKYNLRLGYNAHSLTELYYIYYYLNMYEEALQLLPTLYEKRCINAYSVSISELVMKKQLGIDIKLSKGDKCDYVRSQIFNYSTSSALSHIKSKHTQESDMVKSSYFNNKIDLSYLFNIVRNNIKNSKKVNTEEILETYYFGISNIGCVNDTNSNYIKVIVIPNTFDIISMYPVIEVDYNYISELEIDYDKLFNRKEEKVKRISQIDKFNNKFKRV